VWWSTESCVMCVLIRANDFDYNFDEGPPSSGYTPNPATPGYHADTPSPQEPYNPQTPGSAYSPYQSNQSPSPVSFQGNLFFLCFTLSFFLLWNAVVYFLLHITITIAVKFAILSHTFFWSHIVWRLVFPCLVLTLVCSMLCAWCSTESKHVFTKFRW